MVSTQKSRSEAVAQANANAALEGYEPDAQDLDLQALFVEGEISTEEMLDIIREQAVAAANGGAQ